MLVQSGAIPSNGETTSSPINVHFKLGVRSPTTKKNRKMENGLTVKKKTSPKGEWRKAFLNCHLGKNVKKNPKKSLTINNKEKA